MKKGFKNKAISLVVVFVLALTTLSSTALAASKLQTYDHKVGTPTNKVWTIKLNKALGADVANNLKSYITVTSPRDGIIGVGLSYDGAAKAIIVQPPSGGYRTSTTYTLIVKEQLYDSLGTKINGPTVMEFSTVNSTGFDPSTLGTVETYNLNYSLDTVANNQVKNSPVVSRYYNYNGVGQKADILQYMDPAVFKNDDFGIYQFLNLNYMEGITEEHLNKLLNGKGILSGYGQAFEKACKNSDVSQAYAVSHALLETGNGTSQLAKGVEYEGPEGKKIVYNFFGIGAYDSDPVKLGAKRAYELGWFTPELAIEGGVDWIGKQYINSSYKQNTLYKMRWNANNSGTPVHQYATDVAWAYKQINNMINILRNFPGAKLKFNIPVYK